MASHKLVLTPAPGAVFLRSGSDMIEMTPGEALRVCEELRSCIGLALAAADGGALRHMLPSR